MLSVVFIPYFIRVFFFIKWVFYDRNITWVWSSVSVSCSQGMGTYILAFICSYTAVYLSSMHSLSYDSHKNDIWTTICFILDLFANVMLCGVGIFPTSFHRGMVRNAHFISAGLFFVITAFTNLRWSWVCTEVSGTHVMIAKVFAIWTLVLGFLFGASQLYMMCCLRRCQVFENTECLVDESNYLCEECGRQRRFPWMNFVSFIFEMVTIISIVFASLLKTLTANRWFKLIGLYDSSSQEC